jgi:DNA polymerase IIIc chi subunit
VLRNRDELDAVLAETEMEAIPFELYRGANPQPVGPVSLALKSTNSKHQRYTLCVYIQNSCTELKNRTLHEVVQFVVARNSPPLRVIGTKMSDDEMVGYLEVPRGQNAH